jgi:hypothetical protein
VVATGCARCNIQHGLLLAGDSVAPQTSKQKHARRRTPAHACARARTDTPSLTKAGGRLGGSANLNATTRTHGHARSQTRTHARARTATHSLTKHDTHARKQHTHMQTETHTHIHTRTYTHSFTWHTHSVTRHTRHTHTHTHTHTHDTNTHYTHTRTHIRREREAKPPAGVSGVRAVSPREAVTMRGTRHAERLEAEQRPTACARAFALDAHCRMRGASSAHCVCGADGTARRVRRMEPRRSAAVGCAERTR